MKWKFEQIKNMIRESGGGNKKYLSVIDEQGDIIYANAQMIRQLHLKNPRFFKTNFSSLVHPYFHNDFRTSVNSSLREEETCLVELSLKNSTDHPMRWKFRQLPSDDRKFLLCIGEDLPTLSKTSSTQIGDPSLIPSMMQHSPNMAWIVDKDMHLIYANHAFCHYFGLDETAINKKIDQLIPGTLAESLQLQYLRVMETSSSIETERSVKWANGSELGFHIDIFPVITPDNIKMAGVQAVNLTDHFAREKQLRDLNDRLLNLSSVTANAVWEWDLKTGKIFRNEVLLDMIGYPVEHIRGLSWWLRRIHPEDRERVENDIRKATENSLKSWEEEYRFQCADGSYIFVRDHQILVYENGVPVKMIGSLEDITQLKEAQDKLIMEKVEHQLNLSETVIQVQEKERTRIGRELHDNVNQILGTTKLFMSMVHPVSDEEKEIKDKSIEYLVLAIEEIRKLSKELVTPEMNETNLIESIRKLIAEIEFTTDIRVNFKYDDESELLSPGKKITLFRIAQEQLKNIIKYSQTKKVDIILESPDSMIELRIRDYGIGFDPKKSRNGIGLTNIHERAKFYNGNATITAAPGKGCELHVSIPLYR